MYKRKLMTAGLAIALAAATGFAMAAGHQGQGQGKAHGQGHHGNPEQRMQRMQEHLDLSEEQVSQMRAIRDSDATRQEKREQMRGILTEEQRARVEEHRAMRREQGRGHHGPGGGAARDEDGEALEQD